MMGNRNWSRCWWFLKLTSFFIVWWYLRSHGYFRHFVCVVVWRIVVIIRIISFSCFNPMILVRVYLGSEFEFVSYFFDLLVLAFLTIDMCLLVFSKSTPSVGRCRTWIRIGKILVILESVRSRFLCNRP